MWLIRKCPFFNTFSISRYNNDAKSKSDSCESENVSHFADGDYENIQKMLVRESIPRAIRESVSSLTEVVLIRSVRCGVCYIINKIHEKLLSSDWLR